MNNSIQSIKYFFGRLTITSWVLIIIIVGLAVALIFTTSNNQKSGNSQQTTSEPQIENTSGLIENVEDIPTVSEGDDTSGEILPPDSQPPAPEGEVIYN